MSMSNKLAKAGIMGDAAYTMMGDPGIFGSIWKGIKSVGRVATGIVGGLGIPVVSGVARTAGGILFGPAPGTTTYPTLPPAPMPMGPIAGPGSVPISRAGGGWGQFPTLGQAGQQRAPARFNPPAFGPAGVGMSFGEMQAAPSMGGYHLNKTGYFLRDGTYVPPLSKWVKNRRRNPGNMRALSRSLGRIKSAKRMTQALSAITIRSSCPPGRSRSRSKH